MTVRARVLSLLGPLLRLWWNKRFTRVVRVIVRHGQDVLLVRHSYGAAAWGVPGGGIKRGEDPLVAAARETVEETGLSLFQVRSIADNPVVLPNGELWVYVAEAESRAHAVDRVEILEARWCKEGEFPTEILAQARQALDAAGVDTA